MNTIRLATLALCVLASPGLNGLGGCSSERHGSPGVLTVSVEQQSSWSRNFNPFVPGSCRWPTRAGVYEPLFIYNAMTGEWTPWLGLNFTWSPDLLELSVAVRTGARWSDGQPFTADDVVFTFELLRKHRALDAANVWGFLRSVESAADGHVVFRFSKPLVPGFVDIAHLPIVPRHVWTHVEDPLTFANPSPIGTGPFTEIRAFRQQVYELGRNPFYWQPGKPAIEALRFPAFPGNDQANLALVEGEVDWAGNFVPVIDRTFVGRDKEHHHYWLPQFGSMVFLYPNATRPPLGNITVRRALSLAIDRKKLVHVAMYGLAVPAHPSGLSDAYSAWRAPHPPGEEVVSLDLPRANQLLDDAGILRSDGGMRRLPGGQLFAVDVDVVSGWSDWVRAGQLVVRDLRSVGVDATLRTYEFSTWFAKLQQGDFDLSLAWSADGPSPYNVYKWLMSTDTRRPLGDAAVGNWHRFADTESDGLLRAFEATSDPTRQREISRLLQARFVSVLPAIPLFPNPLWGAFNTTRFTGFPDADHPFAKLSPNSEPDALLVLTSVTPIAPPVRTPPSLGEGN